MSQKSNAFKRKGLVWLFSVMVLIPSAVRGDTLSPQQTAQWRQKVQNSISGGDYQTVLDAFRTVLSTPYAQEYYTQAQQIYTETMTAHPGSENAFYAGKGLLFLQILSKNPAAPATLDGLKAAFPEHPGLITILREAADQYYYYTDQTSMARDLYHQALNQTTGSEAMAAQRGLAMTTLRLGDTAAAESAFTTLLANYSDHPQIALAVKEVANAYLYYTNDPVQARALYQRILRDWPDSSEAMAARRGLAITSLRFGDTAAAETALETLLADYSDHPRIALAVKEVANAYLYYANDPQQARTLYERILHDWPDSSEAMAAQRGLALAALELGDKTAARTATDKLLSVYSNHPQIAPAVREVADQYFYVGQDPAKACLLYERILRDWTNSPEAMAAQRGLAMAKVRLGDLSTGRAAAETLLADFADRAALSENTGEIIDQYCRAGRVEEVISLSEEILSHNPTPAMALAAYTGLARASVQLGHPEKTDEIIEILLSRFSQENRIGYSLFVIGEEFYSRAKNSLNRGDPNESSPDEFQKAIAMWEMVRMQSADSLHQVHAVYYSAVACHEIGQYENALTYYQQIVDLWPLYEKAWYAQFMIAQCSEELARRNKMPLESVRAAYQKVIDKYPDCSAAKLAAGKISSL